MGSSESKSRPNYNNLSFDRDFVALSDFVSRSNDELSVKKGEVLKVAAYTNDANWYLTKNLRTKLTGYVPCQYLTEDSSLDKYGWFFSNMNYLKADSLLDSDERSNGKFLVWAKSNEASNQVYVLSLLQNQTTCHFNIENTENGSYYIEQKIEFNSLEKLIEHYKTEKGNLPCLLKTPVQKVFTLPRIYNLWEEKPNNVTLNQMISSGTTSDFWKGEWRKKPIVIVKRINFNENATKNSVLQRIELIKPLQHRNILEPLCIVVEKNNIKVLTEAMVNGPLLSFLHRDTEKKISFKTMIYIASQIAEGMKYLFDNKFVHCDLAARNIVIGQCNTAKIANFELMQKLNENNQVEVPIDENHKIPVKWTAPEAFTMNENKKRVYTNKSDVWSFGILLWEIVTHGETPYPSMASKEILQKIREEGYRMPKPEACSQELYDNIILKCWQIDPAIRPTFDELIDSFQKTFSNETIKI